MLLNFALNWAHHVSPVTDGSSLKSPNPRKKLGLTVCKRARLLPTVRLPISPEALNEKLLETALAAGTIPFRNVGKEKTDRAISMAATGTACLICFARSFSSKLLLKDMRVTPPEAIVLIL